ncbi:zonular occludens toxin domain-containing protein [Inediibacterium massiliense]|uniref:zonular occludens toxin domain-containing protein n=1 Tax=Inediibacterium massiliense TaxID=1658111 RepID=UPI0006B658DE|nr:zonular occludens toxin domain-containing protein [Inediibacterium massiliense]
MLKKEAIKDSLIIIDEASIEYNNRMMKMHHNEIQYFKLHRHYVSDKKYSNDIIVISQSWEDIDITLRRLYSKMYLLNKLPFGFTMIREIVKKISCDDEKGDIIEKYKFYGLPKFFYRPLYYNMFDSFWIPEDIPIKDVEDFEELEVLKPKTIKDRLLLFSLFIKEKYNAIQKKVKSRNVLLDKMKKGY